MGELGEVGCYGVYTLHISAAALLNLLKRWSTKRKRKTSEDFCAFALDSQQKAFDVLIHNRKEA